MTHITPTSPYHIKADHPDKALGLLVSHLKHFGVEGPSRNGPVVRATTPFTIVWENLNRVSSSPLRDANPFLHLIEAVWMLAGRDDVATVAKLAPNMANYSDNGVTLSGAYGYRWRNHFGFDQIELLINELKSNPTTRRAVLIMHDAWDLTYGINGGLDQCCNFAIMFDVVDNALNMTVVNRSNDSVLGACGANLVHMSILHEYMAGMTNMPVGVYYQTSNNMHLYTELNPVSTRCWANASSLLTAPPYPKDNLNLAQLSENDDVVNTGIFEQLLLDFMDDENYSYFADCDSSVYDFVTVVCGMSDAFKRYKRFGPNAACEWLASIAAENPESAFAKSPWRMAAIDWLARRPSYTKEL
jgi:thymidylate synthase